MRNNRKEGVHITKRSGSPFGGRRIGIVGKRKPLVKVGADMKNYMDRTRAAMENTILT